MLVATMCAVGICCLGFWFFTRYKSGNAVRTGLPSAATELGAATLGKPWNGAALRLDANSFLESLFSQSLDAIYVLDAEGRVKLANKAFEDIYGYRMEELLGRPLPTIPTGMEKEYDRLLRKARSGGIVNGFETVRRRKNGEEIHVSTTLSPIRDDEGEVVALAGISRNISERKETEELLRRSEKLSVVGQLAAGVAHEIRNPLTTLRGFVQLQQQNNIGNPVHLELMLAELDRINFIISEFMVLAKPQLNHYQVKDIRKILTDILTLLETQTILNNVLIETHFEEGLPLIHCEENQLKQVFLNILKNGMEAMPEGGDILLEALLLDPGRIMVRITDNGSGIPPEHLSRLGEPFFTSKEKGTGLGIMVSQRIITSHRGSMLFRSELGKGTSVDIVLPTA